jgi:class 3 adenylate cyclase
MLGSLRGKMPAEIADDLDVVIAEFQRYGEILQEYGDDMMAAFADPELSTLMTSDEYLAANERLNAWFETECGG